MYMIAIVSDHCLLFTQPEFKLCFMHFCVRVHVILFCCGLRYSHTNYSRTSMAQIPLEL